MTSIAWQEAGGFEDIKYHKAEGIAEVCSILTRVALALEPDEI